MPNTMRFRLLLLTWLTCAGAAGGDWPQILGPTRSGVAVDERIRRDWTGRTPRKLWEHPVGQGYAGPAVADGRVVVFHRLGDQEVVEALDAETGRQLWRKEWPARYRGGIDPDKGPRCVPLIHDGFVFLHGIAGRLACLRLEDGTERWARDTREDFRFNEGYFGAASSPLVMGDLLLVNVGGRDGSGVVAFSCKTGRTAWKSTDEDASYSSPISATMDGRDYALVVARLRFLGLDPKSGDVRFEVPFGKRGPTVNAASPLLIDDRHVLLTASYGIGAQLVRIDGQSPEVVWSAGDVLSSQYPTPVVHEGAVYGMDGREDLGVPNLRCLDPLTGRIHWSEDGFGMATPILADDLLIIMKTDGELVLVEPTTQAYRELARFRLFRGTTRALPALSQGRLYIRDSQTLTCVDLAP